MTKLCINCIHILNSEVLPDDQEYARCGFDRPISLVTGLLRTIPELPYCSTERLPSSRCKPAGEKWAAADDVMTAEEEELMKGMPNV